MSASKSSGHFWPAYVDLMTVLLMVFLLLTLLFQMVASIARMQEGQQLKMAATLDAAATTHSGGLLLTFANTDSPLLESQKKEVHNWILSHLDTVTTLGLSISARIPQSDDDVGRRLSSQFARVLEIKKLAAELEIDEPKLYIVNQIAAGMTAAGEIQLFVGRK